MIARKRLSWARVERSELMSPMAMLFTPEGTLAKAAEARGVVRREEVRDMPWNTLALMTSDTRLPWSKLSSRMGVKSRPTLSRTSQLGLPSTVLVTWSAPGDRRGAEGASD